VLFSGHSFKQRGAHYVETGKQPWDKRTSHG